MAIDNNIQVNQVIGENLANLFADGLATLITADDPNQIFPSLMDDDKTAEIFGKLFGNGVPVAINNIDDPNQIFPSLMDDDKTAEIFGKLFGSENNITTDNTDPYSQTIFPSLMDDDKNIDLTGLLNNLFGNEADGESVVEQISMLLSSTNGSPTAAQLQALLDVFTNPDFLNDDFDAGSEIATIFPGDIEGEIDIATCIVAMFELLPELIKLGFEIDFDDPFLDPNFEGGFYNIPESYPGEDIPMGFENMFPGRQAGTQPLNWNDLFNNQNIIDGLNVSINSNQLVANPANVENVAVHLPDILIDFLPQSNVVEVL